MEDYIRTLEKDLSETFFIRFNNENFEEKLESFSTSRSGEFQEVNSAFHDNINSVISTAIIPDIMSTGKANLEILNRVRTQETILSLQIRDDDDPDNPRNKSEKQARIDMENKIHERFLKERKSDKGQMEFRMIYGNFLKDLSAIDSFKIASKNLLNQCTLSTWSAFEVFCRDSFIILLNNKSELVEILSEKADLKQKFNLKNVPVQKLVQYNYDLSKSMGSILIENFEFSNINTIKTIYKTIFDSSNLREKLDDEKLWLLYQRRNLIAHKSGIVDNHYLKSTNQAVPLKSKIWIQPSELLEYVNLVIETTNELRKEIENYCA